MRRGTTPTLTIRIRDGDGDLTEYERIYATIKQVGYEITKVINGADCIDNLLKISLTQEETLRLRAGMKARVQLRCITKDGIATATNISEFGVDDVLKEGVIE